MTRSIAMSGVVLAICIATSSAAQHIEPGKIVSLGHHVYTIRIVNESGPLNVDIADGRAMKQATEFCARRKRSVVVKDKTFDMGSGYTLTWGCVQEKHAPIIN